MSLRMRRNGALSRPLQEAAAVSELAHLMAAAQAGDWSAYRRLLEVRFRALAPDRTAVELTQSNWEGFGDMAEMLRGGYVSGWPIIFEDPYRRACDAAAA